LHLVCEDGVLVFWFDLHFSFCRQQQPKYERAIYLVYLPYFFKIHPSSNPKEEFKEVRGRTLSARFKTLVTNQN
jgi:hypothetical protein